ncbi:MAG: YdeI/OmpD-associated family protein [Gemmatimonadaceae bacterium]|nr:YdeI/OmpD-associated family protein [Gemmatimonadaceae bacterium]
MTPRFFRTLQALHSWFAKHHASSRELWIGYYKKASGKGGVVYQEALDEALCWGWIDGQIKSIDEDTYMQRWTPRKPTSNWSNVNVKKVQALIAAGRMQPAGIAAFERRTPERTGIYSFEKAPPEFSPAFLKRFKAEPKAWAFFEAQPPGYRRTVTAYVMTAKREETRERRLAHVISHSARQRRIPEYAPAPRQPTPPRRAP